MWRSALPTVRKRAARKRFSLGHIVIMLGAKPPIFIFLAVTCVTPGLAQTTDSTWVVRLRSFGPIRFGMTEAEARLAIRDPTSGTDPYAPTPCEPFRSNRIPEHVMVFVVRDTVVGVSVENATVRTARGAGIGDTVTRIRSLYGDRIRVRPHPRWPKGHFLLYVPADSVDRAYFMRFETDGNQVLWFRAGLRAVMDSVQACY